MSIENGERGSSVSRKNAVLRLALTTLVGFGGLGYLIQQNNSSLVRASEPGSNRVYLPNVSNEAPRQDLTPAPSLQPQLRPTETATLIPSPISIERPTSTPTPTSTPEPDYMCPEGYMIVEINGVRICVKDLPPQPTPAITQIISTPIINMSPTTSTPNCNIDSWGNRICAYPGEPSTPEASATPNTEPTADSTPEGPSITPSAN